MPLMLLGGINRRDTMEAWRWPRGSSTSRSLVPLLREPDLVNRLAGHATDAGVCIHCNRCMPTIYSAGGTHCPIALER